MKIEVDLNDIFSEETAECSLEEAIRTAIVDRLTAQAAWRIDQKMTEEINRIVPLRVNEVLDSILPEILNYEFTETGRYGAEGERTTVKARICKDIEKVMQWKDGCYDSDRSTYTKVVKAVVENHLKGFVKEFHKDIDSRFMASCLEYAGGELKRRMGIK
jgi:hypothetical protein